MSFLILKRKLNSIFLKINDVKKNSGYSRWDIFLVDVSKQLNWAVRPITSTQSVDKAFPIMGFWKHYISEPITELVFFLFDFASLHSDVFSV